MPRRSTPNPLAKRIGTRIAQLRREQGLTSEKLAYESEVGSKGYVSDIEHGLALPSLTTLENIARRLDVPLYDLLVLPTETDRERLIDLTRQLPKGPLARLLRELEAVKISPTWVPQRLRKIRTYAALEVAAGWSTQALPRGDLEAEVVALPGTFQRSKDFAVRASGHSMVGFRATIRHGDWLVMRKGSVEPDAVIGQVVLVAREDRFGDRSLHVKRVTKKGRRVWFGSDDKDIEPLAADEGDSILAQLVNVVKPESMAPPPQSLFRKKSIASLFGLSREPADVWSRVDGHLVFQFKPGQLQKRSALPVIGCDPRPAETAYVVITDAGSLEYVGLARFDTQRECWQLDELADAP